MAAKKQTHSLSPEQVAEVLRAASQLVDDRPLVMGSQAILGTYEITPQDALHDADMRHRIADHYWRANDAIRRRDYDTAEAELRSIRALAAASRPTRAWCWRPVATGRRP